MSADCRHPEIAVTLVGQDGNAFNLLGLVQRELKRHGVSDEERAEFFAEATSGDYNHLLGVIMAWVEVS